jgi:hypothetical protein
MMKKLAVFLALLVLPVIAMADEDREILLTPDGTLYTVERAWSRDYPFVAAQSNSFLLLNERRGEQNIRYIVPGTLADGIHTNPTLAYDAESKTVFVFWQYSHSLMHSELYFSAFSGGNWTPELTFGSARNARSNLRIAVTRKVIVDGPDGESVLPEINVHAVWWEFDSATGKQAARYALVGVEKGQLIPPAETYTLASFGEATNKQTPEPGFNADILKHPALFVTPTQDTVDIVFGNTETNAFHRVTLRPTKPGLDARIRIPVGIKDQPLTGSPRFRTTSSDDRIAAFSGDADRVVFYLRESNAVHYVMYKNGAWAAPQAIALDAQVTSDAAVSAIRRMLNDQ